MTNRISSDGKNGEDNLEPITEPFKCDGPKNLPGGPPVDTELLLQFQRKELSQETRRKVALLTVTYKSWQKAYTKIALDAYYKEAGKNN